LAHDFQFSIKIFFMHKIDNETLNEDKNYFLNL
jgi:hypothetical protein